MWILIVAWTAASMGNARSEHWQEVSMQQFGTEKSCIEAMEYIRSINEKGSVGAKVKCVPNNLRGRDK